MRWASKRFPLPFSRPNVMVLFHPFGTGGPSTIFVATSSRICGIRFVMV